MGEAFKSLEESLEVQANMDGIHPTPLYEHLERALQLHNDCMEDGEEVSMDLICLVPHVEVALANLSKRGLDSDGNGGVVLQKAAHVMLTCADDSDNADRARELRMRSLEILRNAKSLLESATEEGDADLAELCVVCAMQIGL